MWLTDRPVPRRVRRVWRTWRYVRLPWMFRMSRVFRVLGVLRLVGVFRLLIWLGQQTPPFCHYKGEFLPGMTLPHGADNLASTALDDVLHPVRAGYLWRS